jgi:hypothetical protein
VPSPYINFLDTLSFMTLDMVQFVPFECMYTESSFDHVDALFLESMVPLALLVAAQLITTAQAFRKRKESNKQAHVLSLWLMMMFLILPVVSRRVFQSFRCEIYGELKGGDGGRSTDHRPPTTDHRPPTNTIHHTPF